MHFLGTWTQGLPSVWDPALGKQGGFAECLGLCTRQTGSLCRVSSRYDTRQSHRHRYPSVPSTFFAEGRLDTRQSVCRVLDEKHSANTSLPSVTLGKAFAECI